MNFSFLATNDKLRSLLPFYVLAYSSYFEQPNTVYHHGSPNHHLIVSLGGTGYFKTEHKEYKINKGDIIFYKSGIPCSYNSVDNWTNCWITFNGVSADSVFEYFDFTDHFIFRDEQIEKKIKDICALADNSVKEEILSGRLYSLINQLGLLINSATSPKEYEMAIKYITGNYNKDISIADIAKHCDTSFSTLYRQFFDIEKTTPLKYLTQIRINWAKLYLETNPHLSIKEIGEKVGFTSTSYFIETFKKSENITPFKYRKMFK